MKIHLQLVILLLFLCMGAKAQEEKQDDKPKRKVTFESLFNINESRLEKEQTDSVNKPMVKQEPDFTGLVINQDQRIELLCQQYMEEKKIHGYRIQLFSGHSRWEASKVKSNFIGLYPEMEVPNLLYQSPNFKLRVGNYRNRFDAEKNLREVKKEFPAAFLVKDEINIKVNMLSN